LGELVTIWRFPGKLTLGNSILEKSKTRLATNRVGGYSNRLNGRFVNTSLPFLVRDCRWSHLKRPAKYLVLLLNFLHETGCDGTGCVVGGIANDDALEFVSALGRGHVGHSTAGSSKIDRSPSGVRWTGRGEAVAVSCVRILGRLG
jgi:hypothetical protein